jgi:very-short-patch-repair endonuclease
VDICGRRIVLDVVFVAARLALEIDGWAHHHDVDRFQADRRRQNLLVGSGWRVLTFTYADLTTGPDDVLRQVQEALATT